MSESRKLHELLQNSRSSKSGVCYSCTTGFRFRSGCVIVRATDSQRIHPVLEHPPADPELGGGVGLDVVVLFQGVKNDFSFEFHHGFSSESRPARVSSRSEEDRVSLRKNGREMFGGDGVRSLRPDERLFDDVFHLSHIARPRIAGQEINRHLWRTLGSAGFLLRSVWTGNVWRAAERLLHVREAEADKAQ